MQETNQTSYSDDRVSFAGPFGYLMLIILAMILATPYLQDYVGIRIVLDLFYTAIFIIAMYVVSREKQLVTLAAVFAVPMILSLWSHYLYASNYIIVMGRICGIIFFAITIIHCGRFILKSPHVTRDVIIAAVVIYLLMALMWSYAYSLLALYQPESFSYQEGLDNDSRQFFLYYSFITITTLGYGDITPLTEKAKSMAILEAFIGQVYLVVVLAWLVGMHVSRKSK